MSAINREPKIVVIGAGFAGLSAASHLTKHGYLNVTILEAMDRPGGRVHTTKPFGENVIDLGANWIHGQDGNPIFIIAKEHGLLAENDSCSTMCLPGAVTPKDYFFHQNGKLFDSDEVEHVCQVFDNLMSKAFNEELGPKYKETSLGDYLDEEFSASELISIEGAKMVFEWCKRVECTDEACSSLYEFSVSQLRLYTALEGGFFNSLGPGGYQAILDILLKSLPLGILVCSTPVKFIKWNLNQGTPPPGEMYPVKVICDNDEELEADHVIVTVPLGYLQEKATEMFHPPLPDWKIRAINRLGFGTVSKIFLEFEKTFWPVDCSGIQLVWEQGHEDKDTYMSMLDGDSWKDTWYKKICGFDTVARHPNVLCGWITGKEAEYMEILDDNIVGETCTRLLRLFTNWNVSNPVRVVRSLWKENPYVRGSYTYIPVGVDAQKEQEALAEPLPSVSCSSTNKPLQVLFAGEATHVNYYTTTHGAYLSGEREAQRIINYYKESPVSSVGKSNC